MVTLQLTKEEVWQLTDLLCNQISHMSFLAENSSTARRSHYQAAADAAEELLVKIEKQSHAPTAATGSGG